MSSPGKVQLNLRVAPEIRDACRRLASRAGLSLNLWAEGVLEAAGASDAMVPPEPLPGQMGMEQAQPDEAVKGQTGRSESASLTVAEEPRDPLVPSSSNGERDEAPAACPECAGEMQPYALEDPPRTTTRCEDCGYWGDGG